MRKLRRLVTVIWATALTVAVLVSASELVCLTEKDAGRTVALKTGDTLDVALAANPTTGYNWCVMEMNSSVLKQAGEPAFKQDSPGRIGSGGRMTFKFQALAVGQTAVKIVYKRPWEKKELPAKTFDINVTVK